MTTYSFDDLERRVIEAGGLLDVSMETLRDMVGAGKLGAHVRDEIRRGLKKRDLVILGGKLPGEQRSTVWLISPNTDGGRQMLDCLAFIDLDRRTRQASRSGEAA